MPGRALPEVGVGVLSDAFEPPPPAQPLTRTVVARARVAQRNMVLLLIVR